MERIKVKEINNLLDGKGFVKLIDFSPRICPEYYTPEFRIVEAARTTFNGKLKTAQEDNKLLKYLMEHGHTSPLEMVNITFLLKIPKACSIHFLRHRTGKFNEFSQRYSSVEENDFYCPSKFIKSYRIQSKSNKQSSYIVERDDNITAILEQIEGKIYEIENLYKELISLNFAKEVARFYLPMSQYTKLLMCFDLNNFIKMIKLRTCDETQLETRIYAESMLKIAKQIFPVTLSI